MISGLPDKAVYRVMERDVISDPDQFDIVESATVPHVHTQPSCRLNFQLEMSE